MKQDLGERVKQADLWVTASGVATVIGNAAQVYTATLTGGQSASAIGNQSVLPQIVAPALSFAVLTCLVIIYLRLRRRAKAATACEVGSKCFIGQMKRLWPEPDSKVISHEVDEFMALFADGKASEMTGSDYIAKAKRLRDTENWSCHVLYATVDAVLEYYDGSQRDWVYAEDNQTKSRRRRIIIIKDGALISENYAAKLAKIIKKLSNSSELKVIRARSLIDKGCAYILRDFGVFCDSSGKHEALFSFGICEYSNIFSHMPGKQFSTDDQQYARKLADQFRAVWDSVNLAPDFEEARTRFIAQHGMLHQISMPRWKFNAECSMSTANLQDLLDNNIPAIRIPAFASPEECKALLSAIGRREAKPYRDVTPMIERIGTTQFEAGANGKDEYFKSAESAELEQRELFSQSFNPLDRVMAVLRRNFPGHVDIAREPDGRKYFAGLVRVMRNGTLLHVDFARHDAANWCIGDVDAQLAWNLFLTTEDSGGACEIFNLQWDSCHTAYQTAGSYGYNDDIVAAAEKFTISPKIGDIVLFNCRNFHRVEDTKLDRVTVGCFVGRLNDHLVLWS